MEYFNNSWTEVKKGSFSRKPRISLSKGKKAKYINLSPSFMKINKLANKKYVKLLIKKDGNKICMGFIFFDEEVENGYKITKNPSSGAGYISASGVLSQLDITDTDNIKQLTFEPAEESLEDKKLFAINFKIKEGGKEVKNETEQS